MSAIAIVGGGPRGISLVERLGAVLGASGEPAPGERLDLHLIDEHEPGAGDVWRTGQTRLLCMNTLAHAVTLFTEPGASVRGPVREGPTLYEWMLLVLDAAGRSLEPRAAAGLGDPLAAIPAAHRAPFEAHPPRLEPLEPFLAEMAATRPESNPSRALYGAYLGWVLDLVRAWLPERAHLHVHRARAAHVGEGGRVELHPAQPAAHRPHAPGDAAHTIAADAVVLTGGWLAHAPTPAEARLASAVRAAGGSVAGSPVAGGAAAGGSPAGDAMAGGVPAGGAPADGAPADGAPAGASLVEGALTGGSAIGDTAVRAPLRSEVSAPRAAPAPGAPLWVAPGNPLAQDLSGIAAGENVLVRGLGMGFFDALILLTAGRGGTFEEDPRRAGRLRYRASGREPHLVVASHRGYPYLPKSEYGGLPPAAHLPRARATAAELRARPAAERIEFDRELWPAIVRDAFEAHALTILASAGTGSPDAGTPEADSSSHGSPDAGTPEAGSSSHGFPGGGAPDAGSSSDASPDAGTGSAHADDRASDADTDTGPTGPTGPTGTAATADTAALTAASTAAAVTAALDAAPLEPAQSVEEQFARARTALTGLLDPADAFHPERYALPVAPDGAPLPDAAALTAWAAPRLAADLAAARAAAASPEKNGLWSFSAARRLATLLGSRDRFTAESRSGHLRTLQSLGQMVGSGPPAFRTRELLALIEAGVVELAGAHPRVEGPHAGDGFVLHTSTVRAPVRGRVLLDAWMHAPDLRFTADPLVGELLAAGRLRPYAHHAADGTAVDSRAPDVELSSNRAIRADGTPDPVLFLMGLPLEDVFGDTTISPMPGSDPSMLRETDRVARALAAAVG
ncbi:FAD/NAD(P)-binding protein [Brevibacterium sp. BRM-1]|uniref:FAD/NAD(P)-binding protein n=1 Tax=Brevibacterium sp. BRM-1 TaxID=2999062 RepID=UPI00228171BA|nr:FAD/NAD(P)-binding protein [Brevibacterium sp. BRM-1]WAL39483.1 FAD/NAD(P)-binding protein [Brevibacterium sp. BRM-1]